MTDDLPGCRDLDERLAPYVDGDATPDARRSVDAHLAACSPCRQAADAAVAARRLVHDRRARLRTEAPADLRDRCARLAHAQSGTEGAASAREPQSSVSGPRSSVSGRRASAAGRRSSVRRWVPLSLAATLLLAVAGVFVFGLNDPVQALATSLALDHVKCFTMNFRRTPPDPGASAAVWQQDNGWPIQIPRNDPAQALRLVNIRRCLSSDGRVAHLMYMWHDAPLSLYVVQRDAGSGRAIETMGRREVLWTANGRTYAVVADGQRSDFDQLVASMKARVR